MRDLVGTTGQRGCYASGGFLWWKLRGSPHPSDKESAAPAAVSAKRRGVEAGGLNPSVTDPCSTAEKRGTRRRKMALRRHLQRGADGFDFGVVLENFVAHFAAPAGLFVSAEGQRGIENVVAVDPDRTGAEFRGDLIGFLDVARPDARG